MREHHALFAAEAPRRKARCPWLVVPAVLSGLLTFVHAAVSASTQPAPGLEYRVRLEGVSDKKLRALLEEHSGLIAQIKSPPLSRMALEQRAREDRAQLTEALRSEGYYASSIQSRIDFRSEPIAVLLRVETGPLFHVEEFNIVFLEGDETIPPETRQAVKGEEIKPGAPARAADILAARDRIVGSLQRSGFPFAAIQEARYAVDLDSKTMTVELRVAPGQPWRFGEILIEGAGGVDPGFIARKAPWSRGAHFDASKLGAYRQAIEATGLFRSVQVEAAPEEMGVGGELPVRVTLAERKPRTVGAGIQYSTNEGPGGRVFWQHRNLMHRGQTLDFSVSGNPIRQAFEAGYRQPEFLRPSQALFARLGLTHESSDAFDAQSLLSAIGVERQIRPRIFVSGAMEFERARLEDATGLAKVYVVGLPVMSFYESTDDALDPSRGMRLRLRATPAIGDNRGLVSFLSVEATASGYFAVTAKPEIVVALRARLGSIVGANVDDVPANRRFYAGGGGSLRAYGYRAAGPLDLQGNPTGGRAVTEAGAELRIRVGERLGLVPFVEGGNVYEESLPRFDRFLWGAGLGFRYFSPVGPLRLDFAVPLNRRRGTDARLQVYVSIGQAF